MKVNNIIGVNKKTEQSLSWVFCKKSQLLWTVTDCTDCVTPARIPSSATGKLFYIKLDFRRLTSPVFSDREVREILNIF